MMNNARMLCMSVQVCQNKNQYLHLIISVSDISFHPYPNNITFNRSVLGFPRPYLSLSGFYVVSQFETGQDLHGVQADVDPVGWRREPSGEEMAQGRARKPTRGNSLVLFRICFLRTQSSCLHV